MNGVKLPNPPSDADAPSSPRSDDNASIDPFWTISGMIPVDLTKVPIAIQVWDHDSSSGDDLADISPAGNDNNLDFVFDRSNGTWFCADDGIVSPRNCSSGGGGGGNDQPRAKMCFDVGGDRDGDGLLDTWEQSGYDDDGDGTVDVDLPGMGADRDHNDLFLEIDYDGTVVPTREAIDEMRAAFGAAPMNAGSRAGEREGANGQNEETFGVSAPPNPDGLPGITLHVDTGSLVDFNAVEGAPVGTCADGIDNGGDGKRDGATATSPLEVLIGEASTVGLAVTTQNGGPSSPVDTVLTTSATADPGVQVTPSSSTLNQTALVVGSSRVANTQLSLSCDRLTRHQRPLRRADMTSKLRRQTSVVLLACALGMTGCSSNDNSSDGSEGSNTTTSTNEAPPTTDEVSATVDSSPSSSSPDTSPSEPAAVSDPDHRVCGLLTTSEVQSVLGKPVKIKSAHATDATTGVSGSCLYMASDNLTAVTISLIGTSVPRAAYDTIVNDPDTGAKPEPVSGLGEAASAIPFGPGGAGLVSVFDDGILLVVSGQKAGGLGTEALVGLTRTALSRSSNLR